MSDHHLMIYTIFKTTFIKIPLQKISYRYKKNCLQDNFKNYLACGLNSIIPDTDSLVEMVEHVLNKHQPMK